MLVKHLFFLAAPLLTFGPACPSWEPARDRAIWSSPCQLWWCQCTSNYGPDSFEHQSLDKGLGQQLWPARSYLFSSHCSPIIASHIYQQQRREYLSELRGRLPSSILGNALESQVHLCKRRHCNFSLCIFNEGLCAPSSLSSAEPCSDSATLTD